jgi:hypothetical protein
VEYFNVFNHPNLVISPSGAFLGLQQFGYATETLNQYLAGGA